MKSHFHPTLQHSHVSLLHQLVEGYKLSEALSHSHDLGLFGQVQRQLQGCVQPHLSYTATHRTTFKSAQHLQIPHSYSRRLMTD